MNASAPAVGADGGAAAADPLDEGTAPAPGRGRLRLAILAAAAGLWLLPWLGPEAGPLRAGAPAALALVAAWGFGSTLLLARSRRGLRVGEALTSIALAGLTTLLVASRHPWLPGPDRRATSLPIFLPLALLAGLDLLALARRVPAGTVAAVRGGAAAVAAAALAVALEPLAASVALVLAASPAAAALPREARGARRALEVLSLLAAAALFFAPDAWRVLASPTETAESPTVWAFLWRLAGIALLALSARGVLVPEGGSDLVPSGAVAARR